jgi:hypothetical protein
MPPSATAVRDLNGDRKRDIVVASGWNNAECVLLNSSWF